MSGALLKAYDSLKAEHFSKLCQIIMTANIKAKSENFRLLMTQFLKDNYNKPTTPKATKANIGRIIELAGVRFDEVKTLFQEDFEEGKDTEF